jgi:hypothetical protein
MALLHVRFLFPAISLAELVLDEFQGAVQQKTPASPQKPTALLNSAKSKACEPFR